MMSKMASSNAKRAGLGVIKVFTPKFDDIISMTAIKILRKIEIAPITHSIVRDFLEFATSAKKPNITPIVIMATSGSTEILF